MLGRESSVGTRFHFTRGSVRTLGTRLIVVYWEREDHGNKDSCSLLRERTLGTRLTATPGYPADFIRIRKIAWSSLHSLIETRRTSKHTNILIMPTWGALIFYKSVNKLNWFELNLGWGQVLATVPEIIFFLSSLRYHTICYNLDI